MAKIPPIYQVQNHYNNIKMNQKEDFYGQYMFI